MTAITAIILAGGFGTRLRGVVPDVPKPMAPIHGRPFLEYLIDYWIDQGVSRFVLSVGYRHEIIVEHFGRCYKGVPVDYAIEHNPSGTGGGLMLATEKLGDTAPFLVLNGDTYFAVDLNVLVEFANVTQADWCFSLFRNSEEGRYMGMEVSPQGKIISFKSNANRPNYLINGGTYWVHPRSLRDWRTMFDIPISLENDILPAAMDSGQRLFGVEFPGPFIDIGVPDDYHQALIQLPA